MKRLFLGFMVGGLVACSQSGSDQKGAPGGLLQKNSDDQIREAVVNITDNVIIATYRDLKTATDTLNQKVLALREEKTEHALVEAQEAWRASRVPWERNESFLFGPVKSLDLDNGLDTWPLDINDLESVMATKPNLNQVRQMSYNLKGFHAAEYILFGNGEHTNQKHIASMRTDDYNFLVNVSAVMSESAARILYGWETNWDTENPQTKGWALYLKNYGKNKYYKTASSVLHEFIRNGMIKIVQEVRTQKLAHPLGPSSDSADPSYIESQFSWNSLSDFMNNIESVRAVFTGDYNGHSGAGIDDLVRRVQPETGQGGLAERILKQIELCRDKIGDIAGPEKLYFTQAIYNQAARARAEVAMHELEVLEQMLQSELLPLIGD